jgi:hypothetical protein
MFTTEKETTQVQQSGKCAELMESNPSSTVGLHTMYSTAAVDGSSGRIFTPPLLLFDSEKRPAPATYCPDDKP